MGTDFKLVPVLRKYEVFEESYGYSGDKTIKSAEVCAQEGDKTNEKEDSTNRSV
jgi:hypothetical protein